MNVDVVVVNYNRNNELKYTLSAVFGQIKEINRMIVVDNASSDGSVSMVQHCFPQAKLIELSDNIGPVARNRGFEIAKADFIVCLDNDVYFRSEQELNRLIKLFEANPGAGCINFSIYAPESDSPDITNWCHPRDMENYFYKEFATDYISEGACAFRSEALEKVGFYYEPYFMGHEGDDLAVRLLDAGYEIHYCPSVEVCHNHSSVARPGWRTYYYHTRNSIWFYFKNFRLAYALRYVLWYLLVHFLFATKNRNLRAYLKGVTDGLGGLRKILRVRNPVKRTTEMLINELREYKPSILKRAWKHLRSDLFQDAKLPAYFDKRD